MDMVTVRGLKKYYGKGRRLVRALDGIDFSAEKGRFTAIVGASGCGKTTLLEGIAGLWEPTEGSVLVDGVNLRELAEEQRTVFRRRKTGFIFQDFRLIPELTVKENILFPCALDNTAPDAVYLEKLLSLLGLEEKKEVFPYRLSGGEQQRTAIARALITKPAIVLADEPTGSLDIKTGQNVAGLLKLAAGEFHQTLILVTHNQEIAQLADQVVWMQDGRIVTKGTKV